MADIHARGSSEAQLHETGARRTKRMHSMPFGAELRRDGTVRFRLWAPSAENVELCLLSGGSQALLPMEREAGGWYTAIQPIRAGGHYRYRINGETFVPDPASRFQPGDVHGASEIIHPEEFEWSDASWRGRSWEEVVLYELHVGTFTKEGTYAGVQSRLEYLRSLGVTAIELMPLADFPGKRNWGYDGVLPFAPDSQYGRPSDLKRLIDAAHRLGLMVFLDVVYNHFGPEGNYLSLYAKDFFTDRHQTPWGAAINFDGPGSRVVREYYVHNALYWLEEYHFDGLRFDAVHAIRDDTAPDILTEISQAVARGPGRDRHVHLVLENDDNRAHYLIPASSGRVLYNAQWNDDIHHAMHVLATGESGGYYADYADTPVKHLGRCLAEGFAFQGDPSRYRDGAPRGESSCEAPATAFVSFLQNHDQIGNRAFGERMAQLADPVRRRALAAVFLLAPSPPMLFMGEEWETQTPFPFFCDFGPELATAVTEGRRKEFARFPEFTDPAARSRIPDPNDPATFESAVLDWKAIERTDEKRALDWSREVLRIRHAEIVPRIKGIKARGGQYQLVQKSGLHVVWRLPDGGRLHLVANLGDEALSMSGPPGRVIYRCQSNVPLSSGDVQESTKIAEAQAERKRSGGSGRAQCVAPIQNHTQTSSESPAATDSPLPPWSVIWSVESA